MLIQQWTHDFLKNDTCNETHMGQFLKMDQTSAVCENVGHSSGSTSHPYRKQKALSEIALDS